MSRCFVRCEVVTRYVLLGLIFAYFEGGLPRRWNMMAAPAIPTAITMTMTMARMTTRSVFIAFSDDFSPDDAAVVESGLTDSLAPA